MSNSPRNNNNNNPTTTTDQPPLPTRTSSPRHGLVGSFLTRQNSGGKHRSLDKDNKSTPTTTNNNKDDDEQLAEENGKLTMLEVQQDAAVADRFAKLKDELDIQVEEGSFSLSDRAPFLSGERFPFFQLLFREGSSGSFSGDILADENEVAKDDNPIVQIFLWKDPIVSGAWLTAINLGFFTMMFADMSLLTIGCLLAMWQLIVDFCILRFGPILQRSGILSRKLDFANMVRKNRFFSPKLIKQYADAGHEVADMAFGFWNVVVIEGQWADVQFAVKFLFFVFLRSFSMAVTCYLLLVALFTLPISLNSNRVLTEALMEGFRLRWQAWTTRLRVAYEDFGSPVIVGSGSPRSNKRPNKKDTLKDD
jgi:hypothetical protein